MMPLDRIPELLNKQFGRAPSAVENIDTFLMVDGLIVFPILLSKCFSRKRNISIEDDSTVIGEIVFLKGEEVAISSLPVDKYICFLSEYSGSTILEEQYLFQNDYLVLQNAFYTEYKNEYKSSSPIWGGFFHIEDLPNNIFSKTKQVASIRAVKGISIGRQFYKDNLEIAILESNPFNRFLKLYHLLELNFDIHTAEKLRSYLNQGNKELEISRTLKDYNREDIERLKSLLLSKVNPAKLVVYLDEIQNYRPTAGKLFYDYGKESNPIKAKNQFDQILSLGGFNETNVNSILGNSRFNDIIPKLAAYWIYRIRSSIAHNKLGEYLMTSMDEEFIVEFAEPMIKEVIVHVYS